ncbi:major facilitator superfamily domain-containing protein [Mycena vitilis]|nr:major facilitator superfamily domain-containing protein [Mycena vitilis]
MTPPPHPEIERVAPASGLAHHRIRFCMVLLSLVLALFLAVMEGNGISTALPVIAEDLHLPDFIWVASAYAIACTVLLALSGGLAEAFGRRPVVVGTLLLFVIGSAVCGAAQNTAMLICGRVIQGAGAGGIFSLTQIILSDLVSLHERGKYNGLFGLAWALAGGLGPLVSGSLASQGQWRWLFYLNVPTGSILVALLLVFLKVPTPPGTLKQKLVKIDWIGLSILIPSTCAALIGLTWGGVTHPWKSSQVLVPLCVGLVGIVAAATYEWVWAKNPIIPFHLVSNRTSLSGYLQMGITAVCLMDLVYYLPIYYQTCKEASPTASGVDLFGFTFSSAPVSILAGISVAATKRFRPQLWIGWCLIITGFGLLSTVGFDTSRGKSIGYQVVVGSGVGITWSTSYFPVLAPIPVTSSAYALSFLVFCRVFPQVWGVTIAGTIIQNGLQSRLPKALLSQSQNSEHAELIYAIIPQISDLEASLKIAVQQAFGETLQVLWRVHIVAAGCGLIVSLVMKPLPLHTERDKKWELEGNAVGGIEKDEITC